jgi:hypothetical protein
METWLVENWWWVVPGSVAVAWFGFRLRRRGRTEPWHVRLAYLFVPIFDPQNELRRRLSPRMITAYEAVSALMLVAGVGYVVWSLL